MSGTAAEFFLLKVSLCHIVWHLSCLTSSTTTLLRYFKFDFNSSLKHNTSQATPGALCWAITCLSYTDRSLKHVLTLQSLLWVFQTAWGYHRIFNDNSVKSDTSTLHTPDIVLNCTQWVILDDHVAKRWLFFKTTFTVKIQMSSVFIVRLTGSTVSSVLIL